MSLMMKFGLRIAGIGFISQLVPQKRPLCLFHAG
jgi:hypothetical protein